MNGELRKEWKTIPNQRIALADHVRHLQVFPLGNDALLVEDLIPMLQLQILCQGFLGGSVHGTSSILRQYFPLCGLPTAPGYCCVRSPVKKYIADGIGRPTGDVSFCALPDAVYRYGQPCALDESLDQSGQDHFAATAAV